MNSEGGWQNETQTRKGGDAMEPDGLYQAYYLKVYSYLMTLAKKSESGGGADPGDLRSCAPARKGVSPSRQRIYMALLHCKAPLL
jgi:hypothetical protein